MSQTLIATKYARATYELAKEENSQESVLEELRVLKEAIEFDDKVFHELTSHLLPETVRTALVDKLLANFKFNRLTVNLLKLLAHNNRLNTLVDIADIYQSIIDDDMGVIRGTVTSASVLTPEKRESLEKSILNLTKKKPVLAYAEDSSLLAGMVAQVGSYKIDGSVKNQMEQLKHSLTGGAH